MTATTGSQSRQSHDDTDLKVRYGKIGISAVAAALRYCGETKKPAHAPAEPQADERFEELAV